MGAKLYTVKEFFSSIDDLSDVGGVQEIEKVESNAYSNRYAESFDALFDLPENLDFLLDAYFELDLYQKDRFPSPCALFEKGSELWSSHPSLSFISFVSSLEALVNLEYRGKQVEKCVKCGQDRHRVTKKLLDFLLIMELMVRNSKSTQ
ncbi:hypothetical protein QO259_12670 [Salinicola sp. JS01]|uniref:hypothetical protein n=1 Tax=Salinicola sp. JS01 TaxID=3050071 RepID=UPI00255BDE80|nr:hypothetical protein [Salinicola sp. JS01]WIX31667.1 hypothetical protein QO259_12670 [Salinicola sp. JS01]